MIKIKQQENRRSHGWHTNIELTNTNFKCYLSENPSGCGQMILHGWAHNDDMKTAKEALEYLLDIIVNKGGKLENIPYHSKLEIGSIITTVGEAWYSYPSVKLLKQLGFKSISVYDNPRHDGNKQRLYIWKKAK